MQVFRKVKIKTIVTSELRKTLLKEMKDGIEKIEAELSFLEQRSKKALTELSIKASPQAQAVSEQLELEKKKREESKKQILEQIKRVEVLEEGMEVLQGEIEGPVEIKIGSKIDDIFNKEIIVKDGIVVEIR